MESLNTLRNAVTEKLAEILHEKPKEVITVLRNSGVSGTTSQRVDLHALTQQLKALSKQYLTERYLGVLLKKFARNEKILSGKSLN